MVKKFFTVLLFFSSLAAQAVSFDLQNALDSFNQSGYYQYSTPEQLFNTYQSYHIDSFLQKHPKAYYGLFLRGSNKNGAITQKVFNEWKSLVEQDGAITPSMRYLEASSVNKPIDFFSDGTYKEYFIKAWLKEQELCDEYYLFYHGQRSSFGFIQEFTQELIHELYQVGYLQADLPDDFFFIQNPNYMNDIINQTLDAKKQKEAKDKQKSMMRGRSFNKERNRVPHRLSVNAFLFGGSSRAGATTWRFVSDNSNINYYSPNIQLECFTKLGLTSSLYWQFQNEIQEIQNEYDQFYISGGRLLQIAVPKNMIDKCAYLASDGAYKDPVYTSSGNKVTTVSEFFKHFNNGDFTVLQVHADSGHLRPGVNEVEFALPLTADKVLNPYTGIKVFVYSCDPEATITKSTYQRSYFSNGYYTYSTVAFSDYAQKRKELCEKIAQTVMENEGLYSL